MNHPFSHCYTNSDTPDRGTDGFFSQNAPMEIRIPDRRVHLVELEADLMPIAITIVRP